MRCDMQGIDIVNRAMELKGYVYWYGGKRELASVSLANALRAQNPSVWTSKYYSKAMQDVANKKHVCDCSGLVCYAYNISDIGSSAIRSKYKVWNGSPRPGMIAYKKGHVGIIKTCSGKMIEMRGIDYDFSDTRYRKSAGCLTLLYDPNVEY